jgi:hypothetical protein
VPWIRKGGDTSGETVTRTLFMTTGNLDLFREVDLFIAVGISAKGMIIAEAGSAENRFDKFGSCYPTG